MITLFAATGNDVVRLHQDNGGNWTVKAVLTGVGVQCLTVDPLDAKHMYAGTFDNGLFRSSDGGQRWHPVGEGIPHDRILSVAVSPADRSDGLGAVFAGTEPSSIYRSRDGGEIVAGFAHAARYSERADLVVSTAAMDVPREMDRAALDRREHTLRGYRARWCDAQRRWWGNLGRPQTGLIS